MARVERVASMEQIELVQRVSLNERDLTNGALEEELATITDSELAATAWSGGNNDSEPSPIDLSSTSGPCTPAGPAASSQSEGGRQDQTTRGGDEDRLFLSVQDTRDTSGSTPQRRDARFPQYKVYEVENAMESGTIDVVGPDGAGVTLSSSIGTIVGHGEHPPGLFEAAMCNAPGSLRDSVRKDPARPVEMLTQPRRPTKIEDRGQWRVELRPLGAASVFVVVSFWERSDQTVASSDVGAVALLSDQTAQRISTVSRVPHHAILQDASATSSTAQGPDIDRAVNIFEEDLGSLVSMLSSQLSSEAGSAYRAKCRPVDLTCGTKSGDSASDYRTVSVLNDAAEPIDGSVLRATNSEDGTLDSLLETLSSQIRASSLVTSRDEFAAHALNSGRAEGSVPSEPAQPAGSEARPNNLGAMLAALDLQLEQQKELMQQQELLQKATQQAMWTSSGTLQAQEAHPKHPNVMLEPRDETPAIPLAPMQHVQLLSTPPRVLPEAVASAATQHLSALLGVKTTGTRRVGAGSSHLAIKQSPSSTQPQLDRSLVASSRPHACQSGYDSHHAGGGSGGDMLGIPRGGNGCRTPRQNDIIAAGDEVMDLSIFSQQAAAFHEGRGNPQHGREMTYSRQRGRKV